MKKMIIFAGVLGILTLMVVAIAATQTSFFAMSAKAQETGPEPEVPRKEIVIAVEQVINGETNSGEVRLTFQDPPEIPDSPPGAFGVFLARSGKTITLGTGSIEVEVNVEVINDQEPTSTVNVSHSGGMVTIQVTDQTEFLKDTTVRPEITPEHLEAGEVVVPGSVASGSLEDIGENMVLRVWGSYQDGVLVADLVVYEPIQ